MMGLNMIQVFVHGVQVEYENQYAKEFYFIIHNEELKDEIIQAIKGVKSIQ